VPTILHLVPRLPPSVDGVGDYARQLALALRRESGLDSAFLVADPAWSGDARLDGFPVQRLPARDAATLAGTLAAAGGDAVLLHYVGYGYHPRGVPRWLLAGLADSRSAAGRDGRTRAAPAAPRPLLTLFHELWSSGPPWSSVFYLRWLQRRLVRQAGALAAVRTTSTVRMQTLLAAAGLAAEVLPIASPLLAAAPAARPPPGPPPWRVLVFGQLMQRILTVEAFVPFLRELEARQALASVAIVGDGARRAPDPSPEVRALLGALPAGRVVVHGRCPPEQVARACGGSDLFLSYYPAALACKSSTLLTALACGCPPVLRDGADAAPLVPGREFLVCDGTPADVDRFLAAAADGALAKAARAGQEWYRRHADWPVTGRRYAELLAGLLPPPG
jgi:glycosyltransferase involved in cell wall biosynthesis